MQATSTKSATTKRAKAAKLRGIANVEDGMIYEFKCRATGAVIMTQVVAERLLEIMDVSPGQKGIITVAKMPLAIQALEKAVALEKEQLKAQNAQTDPQATTAKEDSSPESGRNVSLAQRAFPMLEMIRAAFAAQKDITWGV
jgi:Domain of unknown function (DUF1840)